MKSTRRRVTPLLAALMAVFSITSCAPEPPPTPAPSGPRLETTLKSSEDSAVVLLDGRVVDFPGSLDYTLKLQAKDRRTGQTVYRQEVRLLFDGSFSRWLQPDLFKVIESGGTSSIDIEVTSTVTSGTVSATKVDSGVFTWRTPTSPISGRLDMTRPAFIGTSGIRTACAPVGTKVHIQASGEISNTTVVFGNSDLFQPGFRGGVGAELDSNGAATLTTTTPCFSIILVRMSRTFGQNVSGITNYTVTWPAP